MNLLIVEDNPDQKLGSFIESMQQQHIDFSICRSRQSASDFFRKNWNNLDGILLDLGLPESSTSDIYDSYMGIKLLQEWESQLLIRRIPIIINSSAEDIPIEIKEKFKDNIIDSIDNISACTDYKMLSIIKLLKENNTFYQPYLTPTFRTPSKPFHGKENRGFYSRTFINGHYTHEGD